MGISSTFYIFILLQLCFDCGIFLHFRFLSGTHMPDDDPGDRYDCKQCRKRHGYRITDSRNQQLIRAERFNPESSDSVACQIQKEHFPVKFLMLRKQNQADQKYQIPHRFIQECRMNLNIRDSATLYHMVHQIRRHIRRAYR